MKCLPFVSLVVVLVLIAGCSSDPEMLEPEQSTLPDQSTPESTIQRLIALYQQKDATEYAKLFTGDFLFEFSNSADPDLANQYSAGWWQEDEMTAAEHLFQGGVNSEGRFQPAAETIVLRLATMVPQDDNGDARDPLTHKVLFTPVTMTVQLPPSEEEPEGMTFVVGGADPAVHRYFLVRGDRANGLGEDQPADEQHWYIWLWRDESTASERLESVQRGSPDVLVQIHESTWGRMKGLYR